MVATVNEQYFAYEARLGSFQRSIRKRGSTAGGRAAKTLNWPHKQISPASLARAGFFFRPSAANPDNTVCFLCEKGLDGWEAGDNPLVEHLTHAPHCGWAVVAAIEAEIGDYGKENPNQPHMMEARKATFAGKWPHDGKKGWKCKTKQLVEAGWKYTPTTDSDDMATCTYCQLALDGWEPNDKPLDEHYSRSPECPFFALVNHFKSVGKSSGRGNAARASKASRLSVQSAGTVASETTAVNDMTAGPEDSILTTASAMTLQGAKKPRAKKATAAKGGRKKAKKGESTEIQEVSRQIDEEFVSQLPIPKPERGRKRSSEAMGEPAVGASEEPVPKKRAMQAPAINPLDDSIVVNEVNTLMADAPPLSFIHLKKGETSNTKSDQAALAAAALDSHASMASLRAPPDSFPDDDEIERQLEADLERQFSEDEEIAHGSDSERLKADAKKIVVEPVSEVEQTPPVVGKSPNYAMFDPTAPEPNEAAIDDELKTLQAEMEVDEPEPLLQVPKKGRKAGTRKASKQTKTKKSKAESAAPKEEPEPPQPAQEIEEEAQDVSVGSTDTVVKKIVPSPTAGNRGHGRPSRASPASSREVEVMEAVESAQPPVKRGRGRPPKASQASAEVEEGRSTEAPTKRGRGHPSNTSLASQGLNAAEENEAALAPTQSSSASPDLSNMNGNDAKDAQAPARRSRGRPAKKTMVNEPTQQVEGRLEGKTAIQAPQPSAEARETPTKSSTPGRKVASPAPTFQSLALPPSTPGKTISPAPSARQPVLSPSQSPQSSDAENQPPSARPSATGTAKRVMLAPVAVTPVRISPSKRNVIAGLRSNTPWRAANLEAIFGTPGDSPSKENEVDRFLKRGKELTSPEKQMTVEEWIYFNAEEAEKKLKHECETLVSRFEIEGTRAINVLEGLEVE